MESDARFYRRRANEELAAASRAVTNAARDRRMQLAGMFLERLNTAQPAPGMMMSAGEDRPALDWR